MFRRASGTANKRRSLNGIHGISAQEMCESSISPFCQKNPRHYCNCTLPLYTQLALTDSDVCSFAFAEKIYAYLFRQDDCWDARIEYCPLALIAKASCSCGFHVCCFQLHFQLPSRYIFKSHAIRHLVRIRQHMSISCAGDCS